MLRIFAGNEPYWYGGSYTGSWLMFLAKCVALIVILPVCGMVVVLGVLTGMWSESFYSGLVTAAILGVMAFILYNVLWALLGTFTPR